jgi:hypothetical protein
MKINLTKKQYHDLLRLVFLGSWMADSHNATRRSGTFDEIEQHILSCGKEFGVEDDLDYDEKTKEYYFSEDFENNSGVMRIIDEYDADTFWETLVDRLAARDLRNTYGEDKIKTMEFEELVKAQEPYIKKYEDEIYENGLANIVFRNDALKGPFRTI